MNDIKKDFNEEKQGFYQDDKEIFFEKGILSFWVDPEIYTSDRFIDEAQTRELYEAMKKYYESQENESPKTGDMVRITHCIRGHQFEIGELCILIEGAEENGYWIAESDSTGEKWLVISEEFEKIKS